MLPFKYVLWTIASSIYSWQDSNWVHQHRQHVSLPCVPSVKMVLILEKKCKKIFFLLFFLLLLFLLPESGIFDPIFSFLPVAIFLSHFLSLSLTCTRIQICIVHILSHLYILYLSHTNTTYTNMNSTSDLYILYLSHTFTNMYSINPISLTLSFSLLLEHII